MHQILELALYLVLDITCIFTSSDVLARLKDRRGFVLVLDLIEPIPELCEMALEVLCVVFLHLIINLGICPVETDVVLVLVLLVQGTERLF